jgi:hypothetical protein
MIDGVGSKLWESSQDRFNGTSYELTIIELKGPPGSPDLTRSGRVPRHFYKNNEYD